MTGTLRLVVILLLSVTRCVRNSQKRPSMNGIANAPPEAATIFLMGRLSSGRFGGLASASVWIAASSTLLGSDRRLAVTQLGKHPHRHRHLVPGELQFGGVAAELFEPSFLGFVLFLQHFFASHHLVQRVFLLRADPLTVLDLFSRSAIKASRRWRWSLRHFSARPTAGRACEVRRWPHCGRTPLPPPDLRVARRVLFEFLERTAAAPAPAPSRPFLESGSCIANKAPPLPGPPDVRLRRLRFPFPVGSGIGTSISGRSETSGALGVQVSSVAVHFELSFHHGLVHLQLGDQGP